MKKYYKLTQNNKLFDVWDLDESEKIFIEEVSKKCNITFVEISEKQYNKLLNHIENKIAYDCPTHAAPIPSNECINEDFIYGARYKFSTEEYLSAKKMVSSF